MATKKPLKDAIAIIDPEINRILANDYRAELDKRITILDLSYSALKVNVYRNTVEHVEAYDYAYRTLVEVLAEKATRQYASITDIPTGYFDKPNAPFVYINGGDSNRFIVSKTFGAARDFVTKVISRDKRLLRTAFGQRTSYTDVLNKKGVPTGDTVKNTRSKVDIGHISTEGQDNLVSPLELKFQDLLRLGSMKNNPVLVKAAQHALSELYAVQAHATYSFKNTAPEAIDAAKGKLGDMYVVVTLHREKLNSAFSAKESEIFNRLRATLALKLSKMPMHEVSGSNTIVEDIAQGILFGITGTKKHKPKKHSTRSVKTKSKTVKPKVGVSSKSVAIAKPVAQDIDTRIGLGSLQTILDAQLQHVVSANMGDGDRTDILNYRTGRFAESARVERLSMSRAGMITAFYSYMNYPYATFSAGGLQGNPKSRDPKLLIAKSIREIAAEHAYNSLRAVNI